MSGQRIVIAGGGIAGLTLALALKRALGQSFCVDPRPIRRWLRRRVPTIAPMRVAAAARNMLEALGIWG